MPRLGIGICCWLIAGAATMAVAQSEFDIVYTGGGTKVTGTITETTPFKIKFQSGKDVDVNDVEYVELSGEPFQLKQAGKQISQGKYDAALTVLEKIKAEDLQRPELKTEYDYYRLIATARLALGGNGDPAASFAALRAFATANQSSYHFLEACEVLGDLAVSLNNPQGAQAFYAKVAEAPWPDYKMRASNAMGRALLAQNKFPEAYKAFDAAINAGGQGKNADQQLTFATLGKAQALAGAGKAADALKLMAGMLDKTDDAEQLGRIYNTLGQCHKTMGDRKQALFDYLHVDLLYNTVPDVHAEALYNLTSLWSVMNKAENGRQAHERLLSLYPNSRWARLGPESRSTESK